MNSSETPQLTLSSARMEALKTAYFVFSGLTVVTCACGTVGNSLVVWLLGFRLQRTPFSVYILNLAVADVFFLLCTASLISLECMFRNVTSPEIIFPDETRVEMVFQDEKVKAIEVMRKVTYLAYTVGLNLLTAISTHRCLSVLFPIWYRCYRPHHLSATVCALLWALPFLMTLLDLFFCGSVLNANESVCSSMRVIFSILTLGVFTAVMILSSTVLFIQVKRSDRQWGRQPSRLLIVILVSVVVFLSCSLPFTIYWFVFYVVHPGREINIMFLSFARLSSSLGSSTNPFTYFFVGKWRSQSQREPLGAVISRVLQEEPELDGSMTSSTNTKQVRI